MGKAIGIVGGLGPYSGIELNKNIFENLAANRDQDYIDVFLLSRSSSVSDRTEFLLGRSNKNPAKEVYDTICMLEKLGASVVGIPCNTCHAPRIYNQIRAMLDEGRSRVKLVNLIDVTYNYIEERYKGIKRIGVLSTLGTFESGIYDKRFNENYEVVYLDSEDRVKVHDAIYNIDYGIKSKAYPVSDKAKEVLLDAIEQLRTLKVEVIILACSELPIALEGVDIGIPLINPNSQLARSLIKELDNKLLLVEEEG